MNNIKIIISRYHEDVSWSEKYSDYRVIYNKGNNIEQNCITLPNIGRESHTYLYHIVENYNNLADYNVFLQGFPYDHKPDLDYILLDLIFNNKYSFKWLSNWSIETDFEYIREPYRIPYVNFKEMYKKLFDVYPDPHTSFIFHANGQFVVSKEKIHERPLEFYKKYLNFFEGKDQEIFNLGLMNNIKGENSLSDPIMGHHAERLWGFVFNV
jgi:hypothetical protein